jgi:MFS family permease
MAEETIEPREPSGFLRWSALLLISLAMCGNYYIYDSISPLADLLKSQLGFTDQNIGLLNAIYSFPNIIMVLLGGMIIDRIGTRKSVFIFTFIIMCGAAVTAFKGSLYTMAAGRLIFGLGAESMIVAITTIIARWFRGKELSFAFGLNLTVARLGSFMALNSPTLAKNLFTSWQRPLLITVCAGIFAVLCITLYYFLDVYASRHFTMPEEGSQDRIEFREAFRFTGSFWFITLLCFTFYSAIFPFQTFAIKFFQEAHGTSREVGGNLSSILTLTAMVLTPLFGILSDKIGKRSLLMMIGSLVLIPVYLIMAYNIDLASPLGLKGSLPVDLAFFGIASAEIPFSLIVPMAMMGFSFSLIPAVMWPSVALVVEEARLGTAYGLMTMIQNIGLFLFNVIIGWANDFSHAGSAHPQGYQLGMWIFSILGFLGLFFSFMLRKSEQGPHSHGLEFGSMHKKPLEA